MEYSFSVEYIEAQAIKLKLMKNEDDNNKTEKKKEAQTQEEEEEDEVVVMVGEEKEKRVDRESRIQQGESKSGICAVLVSIDTLLANFFDLQYRSWCDTLAQFGYGSFSTEEFIEWFHQFRPVEVLRLLLPYSTLDEQQKIVQDQQQCFMKMVTEQSKQDRDKDEQGLHFVSGLRQFLQDVPSNVTRVALTDLTQEEGFCLLESLQLGIHFDVLLSGYALGYTRPSPALHEYALSKLKFDPKCVWCFEGSTSGVISARQAGIRNVIALRTDLAVPSHKNDDNREPTDANKDSERERLGLIDETRFMIDEGARVVLDNLDGFEWEFLERMTSMPDVTRSSITTDTTTTDSQ